jgi:hypothetical protein
VRSVRLSTANASRLSRSNAAALAAGVSLSATADPEGKPSVSTPVTQLAYGPTGVADGVPRELNAAQAYGDLAHGAHGTKCVSPNECILFINQRGKFDYVGNTAKK